ncbi:hypothetical protein CBS101457_000519 [Exobasidium rhododendri]|nr:hypothetical protein CBS101457_000519 [Exobasidium rhododendri]
MALVSGYDSDSDSESESAAPTTLRGLSSLLPPPSASSKAAATQSVGLQPSTSNSTSSAKVVLKPVKKRQIKIDALDFIPSDNDDDDPVAKRSKLAAPKQNGGNGLHSLLGLLPAPKQSGPPPPVNEQNEEKTQANNMGIASNSEGRLQLNNSAGEKGKTKGNNDFRAMLGLKPSSLPAKPRAVPNSIETSRGKADPVATTEATVREISPSASPNVTADFFSLETRRSSAQTPSLDSRVASSISTAPIIEGEEEEEERRQEELQAAILQEQYKGWQQGPDGSWFPVTPEAHAAYNQHLSTQVRNQNHLLQERPADMQYSDLNAIQSIDANAGRDSWLSRPSSQVDSAAMGLDRKYALAAASMAMPEQGIPLVDQDEEVKAMDKKTNFRAERKGQLSSLIAQAEESKEKLEERWSKGKDGRNTAKAKYGF